MDQQQHSKVPLAVHYFHLIEGVVLVLVGISLVVVALLLLGTGAVNLMQMAMQGNVQGGAVAMLGSVLLVMMSMEILYTVAISLESRQLVAEPFLIIGAIAAIRRMLVITATSTSETSPATFQSTLMELGLLALIVIVMAAAIYILRRSHKFVPLAPLDGEEVVPASFSEQRH